ncbi:hypothetical protein BKE38_06590 [Pseudoroseomonas deserti]|uniref:Transmembrane protein n=1 Tax=Teichococcus deserti TaxID=1817963 RepID=A0A1V2H610_9PROT|nr:hypothetical protein [Pseudoroseomonas deserti]ONG56169.1 hypothetical protein BKE38_06590 [Pseudoroseomonas deserti]
MKGPAMPYLREFGLCLLAYGLLLAGTIALLPQLEAPALRGAVVLMPMLPVVAMGWVVLRQLRRIDELQRRIQLEALAFAFAGTAVLSLGHGFLELVGLPRLSMFAVWPVMAILWIVGLRLATRRYR